MFRDAIENAVKNAIKGNLPAIKKSIEDQDFVATGGLQRSIRQNGMSVESYAYIDNILKGGMKPTWVDYKEGSKLFKWVGIRLGTKNQKSTSFLVARKLGKFGNRIYRGEASPLDLSKNLSTIQQDALKNVKFAYKNYLKNGLI